jgi:hypothetical protein
VSCVSHTLAQPNSPQRRVLRTYAKEALNGYDILDIDGGRCGAHSGFHSRAWLWALEMRWRQWLDEQRSGVDLTGMMPIST